MRKENLHHLKAEDIAWILKSTKPQSIPKWKISHFTIYRRSIIVHITTKIDKSLSFEKILKQVCWLILRDCASPSYPSENILTTHDYEKGEFASSQSGGYNLDFKINKASLNNQVENISLHYIS